MQTFFLKKLRYKLLGLVLLSLISLIHFNNINKNIINEKKLENLTWIYPA